jgi:S1-C subfamily serine protease
MAEKILTKCPKCSSKITNKIECSNCGVIFEKYFKAEARKKALAEQEPVGEGKSKKMVYYLIAGVFLVAISSSAFYFLGREHSVQSPRPLVVQKSAKNTLPVDKTVSSIKPPSTEKHQGSFNDMSFIRNARKATVVVKTPWGLGSGFFIGENTVVTNKHVVQLNKDQFDKFKKKVERNEKLLNLERQNLSEYKRRLNQMPDGPSRRELAIIIQTREDNLKEWLPKHQLEMKKLEKLEENMGSQDVEVILSDGTQYSVSSVITSNDHDLALLKVYSVSAPILRAARNGEMPEEGDTVYTIGSPLGLQDTVTRGVFSGYRKNLNNNEEYLQTDAAINPGNSGGPLIDSHGNVLGVNTMILNNTEGIGFAIPIQTVYREFAGSF